MTHAELVERGKRWLRSKGCKVVLGEFRALTPEEPDVIGWRETASYVIECKTSRSDFFADRKKPFRHDGGAGNHRYFLTPPDLVKPNELLPGWGLLYAMPKTIALVEGVDPAKYWCPDPYYCFAPDLIAERKFLLSALGRLKLHHGGGNFDALVHATYASKHRSPEELEE